MNGVFGGFDFFGFSAWGELLFDGEVGEGGFVEFACFFDGVLRDLGGGGLTVVEGGGLDEGEEGGFGAAFLGEVVGDIAFWEVRWAEDFDGGGDVVDVADDFFGVVDAGLVVIVEDDDVFGLEEAVEGFVPVFCAAVVCGGGEA